MTDDSHAQNIRIDTRQIPADEIAAMQHNLWRYHELQRLRLGQPNQYRETSYR